MKRKPFKSKLFNRKINDDNVDYWLLLYADILFRLREIEELKCPCHACFKDRLHLLYLIQRLIEENHLKKTIRTTDGKGVGDCGRRLGPVA